MSYQSSGFLAKMPVEPNSPVQYRLPLDTELQVNEALGKQLQLTNLGQINCVHCGRKTRKSFNQGYCYPCFTRLAQCDICIVSPEKCHYAAGTCREPEWGEQHCMQTHIVYLANSSGLKVGITRKHNTPTRWIDQGASQALPIASVASRLHSGLLETLLKQHVADKTNWRAMLKGEPTQLDLKAEWNQLYESCQTELEALQAEHGLQAIQWLHDAEAQTFSYPVLQYPEKIVSHNLDKTPSVEGTLLGIKGQYLIFDTGVLNIRKYGGYQVEISVA